MFVKKPKQCFAVVKAKPKLKILDLLLTHSISSKCCLALRNCSRFYF